jgi:hypothetical protein
MATRQTRKGLVWAMTRQEYEKIQERLSKKLHGNIGNNKTQVYDDAILTAKSIIKSIYEEGLKCHT